MCGGFSVFEVAGKSVTKYLIFDLLWDMTVKATAAKDSLADRMLGRKQCNEQVFTQFMNARDRNV